MAEFPALPLFTDSFISDTTHLTAAQTGAYLMLLMTAWRSKANALPDDDVKLAKWARMDRRTWAVNKDIVMSFWTLGSDGCWHQDRLDRERKYVGDKANKNSTNARSRWLKEKETRDATALPEACQTDAPTPTPTPTPIIPLRDPLAEMVGFPEFWHLFPKKTEMGFARAAYQKALTVTTHEVIMASLRKQLPALKVKKYPEANATKWLAGECWSDPVPEPKSNYAGF